MINVQSHIVLFTRSVAAAAPLAFRWRHVLPFAVLALVELVLTAGYIEFAAPGVSHVLAPAVAFFFGEESLHYPQHIWNLPAAVDWVRCAAAVLVGFVVFPLACRGLRGDLDAGIAHAAPAESNTATLLLAVTVYALIEVSLQRTVGLLASVPIVGRFEPLFTVAVLAARPAVTIVLAHTVYGSIGGRTGLSALRSGLFVTRQYLGVSALTVGLAALLMGPLDLALAQSSALVDAGNPGIAEVMALLAILWDVPIRLLLFGSVVWLRVSRSTA